MLTKKTFLGIILSAVFSTALAQQKQDQANSGITFFTADTTVQPTNALVIIYAAPGSDEKAGKLVSILSKKGVAVAKVSAGPADRQKAMQLLRKKALAVKVTDPKIGIITIGAFDQLSLPDSIAFAGAINPGALSKDHFPAPIPLFISASTVSKGLIDIYNEHEKDNDKTELHLHHQAVPDSIQTSEFIDWMAGLGLLKPISTERTYTQKRQEDWKNFIKVIDDRLHNDWPWLKRYEGDNDKIAAPKKDEKRVIFFGNSITEGWINQDPEFFKSHNYINRGIGGQTTPQMLVRFREDVVNLHPQVVIVLAGINDIAQNTGPSKIENVAGNIISMAEIAKANGIKVILCTVLPASGFPWHPGIDPVPSIIKLNRMLKEYADENKLGFVDYYSAVVDDKQGFKKELAIDGVVHPNLAGYKIMEPLAEAAINKALSAK